MLETLILLIQVHYQTCCFTSECKNKKHRHVHNKWTKPSMLLQVDCKLMLVWLCL